MAGALLSRPPHGSTDAGIFQSLGQSKLRCDRDPRYLAPAGPKHHALDPRLDERLVVELSIARIGGPQRLDNESLDLVGRGPSDRSSLALTPLGQNRGDVIAVADAGPLGRARGHAVAAVVKEPAHKQGARGGAPGARAVAIGGELRVHPCCGLWSGVEGRAARALILRRTENGPPR